MEEQNNVVNTSTTEKEGSKFGWGVLGFFIPLVGLILFLVWMKDKKRASKAAGIGALIGFLVNVLLTTLSLMGVISIFTLAGEPVIDVKTNTKTVEKKKDDKNTTTKEETKKDETTKTNETNQQSSSVSFVNTDGSYYLYEGKSFIGTGVNNVILSDSIIGTEQFSTEPGQIHDGSVLFMDSPAADMAKKYCTGCRLLKEEEASLWGCPIDSVASNGNDKCKKEYNGTSEIGWWLNDYVLVGNGENMTANGSIVNYGTIQNATPTNRGGVRPAVPISTSATMTGTGTQADPYVIIQ